jgi:hypothetical protein
MNDNQLQNLYDSFLEFADQMVGDYGPMEVAAVMMTQALTIYKSAMSEDDFNRIVDTISSSRNKVKTFERPTMQ